MILSLLGYGLLNNIVLRPVGKISQAVTRGRRATDEDWGPTAAADELGALARTLRDSLTRTDAVLHELENQKFALDQHAIVARTDIQGRITYANDRFCAISGYAREELVGQNHRLLISGTHAKQFFVEMWTTIARGDVWHGEICNRAKNGALYWVDSTIVPLLGADSKPHSYIAIRTDITARKNAEAEVKKIVIV